MPEVLARMAEQSHREPRTHGPPPNAEAIYQELVDANPFFRLMASLDAVVLDCRRRVTLAPRRCVCAAALLPLIVLACRWFHLAFGTPQRQATLAVCITGQTERLELHSKASRQRGRRGGRRGSSVEHKKGSDNRTFVRWFPAGYAGYAISSRSNEGP